MKNKLIINDKEIELTYEQAREIRDALVLDWVPCKAHYTGEPTPSKLYWKPKNSIEDKPMSDLKEILEKHIEHIISDKQLAHMGIKSEVRVTLPEELEQELKTYIQQEKEQYLDDVLRNLHEHALWFEKESGEGFGTYQLGIIIQQGRYRQSVEQFKSKKGETQQEKSVDIEKIKGEFEEKFRATVVQYDLNGTKHFVDMDEAFDFFLPYLSQRGEICEHEDVFCSDNFGNSWIQCRKCNRKSQPTKEEEKE